MSHSPSQPARYRAAWRWHMYAGIYVIPFMLMLSITGLIMLLYQPVIAPAFHSNLLTVQPANNEYVSWQQQLNRVKAEYPEASITQFRLPESPSQSSHFTVKNTAGENINVYVNPYNSEILGSNSKDQSLYALADEIHGTFLFGKTGDALIELAAGYTLVLILTGLFMWWPRQQKHWYRLFLPQLNSKGRSLWKELHVSTGAWLAVALLFLSITGLSWTGIWGAKIIQPWNTFPTGVFGGVPTSDKTHASLNPGVIEEIPWNLEQAPLPLSGSHAGTQVTPPGTAVNLDSVTSFAKQLNMQSFRVNLPRDNDGVYSIVAATMSKDRISPVDDRTLHIDQYSGKLLMDIQFKDYSLIAKAMAVGIPLHMGLWGTANLILNITICVLTLFLCVSGIVLWWKRRPAQSGLNLNPPPAISASRWNTAFVIWTIIAVCFPLTGASLIVIWLLEQLFSRLFKRTSKLQRS
ncbi:PepSY-associated TM helix domain-containing protein [Aliamphritea ceti]|uniref:PepSY-associated TM helix domain-containing protein n=1 Tax=Aliamphritea ceti TaxID=1524258 RepID=UPI0021C34C0B|nr:PepSY domain-containing protein [Aliamphritea ceti]